MKKAIVLFSGGLDSILAAKIALLHNWQVKGLFLDSVFYQPRTSQDVFKAAELLKLTVEVRDISKEQFLAVRNPRFGWGKNLNPCLDCRIIMFKKAKEYLEEERADFLISGEVAGERPFSQRLIAMKKIEKEAEIEGLVLRPLSYGFLPFLPKEDKSFLNSDLLFNIQGRSRSRQLELAQKWGIVDFPSPSGGCLLTDAQFCRRLEGILPDGFDIDKLKLLKLGRHFAFSGGQRLVVGRNQADNKNIKALAKDEFWQFFPLSCRGPFALGWGEFEKEDLKKALAIVARYTDPQAKGVEVVAQSRKGRFSYLLAPLKEEEISQLRI